MREYLYEHENGINFRRVEASDLDNLIALKNESWFGTHRVSLVSEESQLQWLESLDAEDVHHPRNLVLIAVIPDYHPSAIGVFKVLNIDWQSRLADVGWDVYKPYRGAGAGKRIVRAGVDFCFGVLNLHRLNAQILDTNIASYKCAYAAGFIKEGFQPRAIRRNGKWIDNLLCGIVAPEPK